MKKKVVDEEDDSEKLEKTKNVIPYLVPPRRIRLHGFEEKHGKPYSVPMLCIRFHHMFLDWSGCIWLGGAVLGTLQGRSVPMRRRWWLQRRAFGLDISGGSGMIRDGGGCSAHPMVVEVVDEGILGGWSEHVMVVEAATGVSVMVENAPRKAWPLKQWTKVFSGAVGGVMKVVNVKREG
ncbi:hypothetical protein LR48_Vigan02g101600 [Vigna angularis]|uniref:Uncharacterized protein n=1 Tax=Phaseolus angularis TaxID=3914 RepID=A0A0L9TWI7_PHAAN|nr:hypothetical protein LR48_Vigan02g101600 [Vigna angularis]